MSFNEFLGLVMLVSMIGVIFIGFPISFTLLFLAFIFGSIGVGPDQTFNLAYLQVWGTMKDDILPAVPLFIFMGYMTEQAGLMERLFLALRHLLAPVRGALYLAVILTATIFAMATGIVGAAVTVLGIMAGPIMIKTDYDARLSAGAIAAGGTLGILIPPSVMLVVMGPTIGVPVNLLYSAAFGPGFLLAGLYIAYCMVRSFINPALGPAGAERGAAGRCLAGHQGGTDRHPAAGGLDRLYAGHDPRGHGHADGSGFLRRLRRHAAGIALSPPHLRSAQECALSPPW